MGTFSIRVLNTCASSFLKKIHVYDYQSALIHSLLVTCLLLHVSTVHSGVLPEGEAITLNFGPYMFHYDTNANQNSLPWLVGLEWESPTRWEIGGAFFKNSYNQPCGYIYGGKRWFLDSESQHFYLKITGGVLLGYVKPHENAIPINWNGIGVGVIPSVGYKYERLTSQINFLGIWGLLLTVGYELPL